MSKEKLDSLLNQLEQSLLRQRHLTHPHEFELQIFSLVPYFHLMSDQDRDYLNYARIAMEDELLWRIDDISEE